MTPLIAVWVDGAAYLCTGPDEVKARNLADQPASRAATSSTPGPRGPYSQTRYRF